MNYNKDTIIPNALQKYIYEFHGGTGYLRDRDYESRYNIIC